MSIPLVQEATKDAINTSIIAIKRNIERINMLLGLVDNDSPDLSGFATKQELQDAVTELQPVDEVTVGNMNSVTSNAVANALKGTIYATGTGPISRTSGNIRTLSNLPKGIYVIHYGFGYVEANDNYLMFTTTDPQGFCYTSLCLQNRIGWLGELTSIAKLPNGGDVSLSMYSSGSYFEQGNGTGLVAVKICDI